MGLSINSNIPALGAQRNARQTNGILSKALQQLASGRRINRAADDAAGLAIAEGFNSQSRQGRVEINNLQSGISAAQTAEGGLGIQQDAVQRIRELAVQASNGTLSDDQRAALNAEAQQLVDQIDDTAAGTEYNGQNLLNEDTNIDLGTEGSAQLSINESTADSLGVGGIDLSTAGGAAAALESADAALSEISQNRSNIGAQVNRFESGINQREVTVENTISAESAIRDADLARVAIEQSRGQILHQAGLAGLVQSNLAPQSALSLLGG